MTSQTRRPSSVGQLVALCIAAHVLISSHPYLLITTIYNPCEVVLVLDIPDMDEDIYYRKSASEDYVVKDEVRRDGSIKGKRISVRIHAIPNPWSPSDFVVVPTFKEMLAAPDSIRLEDGFLPHIFHPPNVVS